MSIVIYVFHIEISHKTEKLIFKTENQMFS